jgi:hypothetical protein
MIPELFLTPPRNTVIYLSVSVSRNTVKIRGGPAAVIGEAAHEVARPLSRKLGGKASEFADDPRARRPAETHRNVWNLMVKGSGSPARGLSEPFLFVRPVSFRKGSGL